MKLKTLNNLFVILAIVTVVVFPVFVSAAGMVPCGGPAPELPCTFDDFIKMVGNIVNGTVIIISVYAAISFMYAGYAYLTAGGSQEAVSRAKGIFWKVFLGYIIILGAWAFVYMIEQSLYSEAFDVNNHPVRPDSFLNSGTPSPTP